MKLSQKITAVILTLMIVLTGVNVSFAEGVQNIAASAEFFIKNGKFVTDNLAVTVIDGNSSFVTEAGREGFLVQRNVCSGVRLDVDNRLARAVTDGSSFDIEIDVYAKGPTVFCGYYDSLEMTGKGLDSNLYVSPDGEWKTIRYTLDDAYFDNRSPGNSDIGITGDVNYEYVIGAVRIYKHEKKNRIVVKSIKSENVGNIFAEGEEQKFEVTLLNTTNKKLSGTMTMCAETLDGNEVWRGEEIPVTAEARFTTKYNVNVNNTYFGRMRIVAEIKVDDFCCRGKAPYSFVNSIEDGTKNYKFGWNTGIGWGKEKGYIPEKILELVSRSNAGQLRHCVNWYEVEKEKGKYSLPDEFIETSEYMARKNIASITGFSGGNALYEGGGQNGNYIPIGEEAINAFCEYARYVIRELKRIGVNTVGYAMFNEPDLPQFNLNSGTGADIGKVADKIQQIIDEEDNGKPLYPCGFSDTAGAGGRGIYQDMITTQESPSQGVDVHLYSWGVTPEIGVRDALQWYRDKYKEITGGELKMIASELGYPLFPSHDTSENSEEGRAKWNVRNYITLIADGNIDSLMWYTLQDNGDQLMLREQMFGAVKTGNPNYASKNLLYEGKETYAAFANMNKMLQNAECEKVVMENDHARYAYIFRRPKDGKTFMPVWTTTKEQPFEFRCKAEKLVLYDIYGNKSVIEPKNGVYSLTLTDSVIYIEGDLTDIEVLKCPAEIKITEYAAAPNDTVIIPLTMTDGMNFGGYKATISGLNDELNAVKSELDLTQEHEFVLKVANTGISKSVTLEVRIEDGNGNLKYSEMVKITGVEAMKVRTTSFPTEDINKWGIEVMLANNTLSQQIDGVVEIVEPAEFASIYGAKQIKTIPGGRTARIEFEAKDIPAFGIYPIDFRLKTNDGNILDLKSNIDFSVASYANEKPKIDGYIAKGEWDERYVMLCDKEEQAVMSDYGGWSGKNDLSAKVMVKYDDEYFYLASDVIDDTISLNPYNNGDIWMYDSMQMGISFDFVPGTGMDETRFTEISFGDTDAGPFIYRRISESEQLGGGAVKNAEFKLRREGVHTYYEMAIPWNEITDKKIDIDNLESFRFSLLVNDNDGKGRKGWLEYGSGIGATKDISLFLNLKLVKNK